MPHVLKETFVRVLGSPYVHSSCGAAHNLVYDSNLQQVRVVGVFSACLGYKQACSNDELMSKREGMSHEPGKEMYPSKVAL